MKEQIKVIAEDIFQMSTEPGFQVHEDEYMGDKIYVEFDVDVTEFPMEETTGYRKMRVDSIYIRTAERFSDNSGRTFTFTGLLQDEVNTIIERERDTP